MTSFRDLLKLPRLTGPLSRVGVATCLLLALPGGEPPSADADDSSRESAADAPATAEPLPSVPATSDPFVAGDQWVLETHGQASAARQPGAEDPTALRVAIASRVDAPAWQIQLRGPEGKVRAGQAYVVRFRVRADRERDIECHLAQNHEPWANLGLNRRLRIGPTWKTIRLVARATADDDRARLHFNLGQAVGWVELAGPPSWEAIPASGSGS